MVAIAASMTVASAQVEVTASFGPSCHADVFELPATDGRIRAHVCYANATDDKRVSILFRYQKDGASFGRHDVEYTTAFQPTFTVPRCGTTDTLYVGGWNPRLGATVIEAWVFTYALGSSVSPATQTEVSSLAVSPPTKETIAVLPGVTIVHASSNPYGDEDHLYLLQRTPNGRTLLDMDVTDASTSVVFTGDASTGFGSANSVHTGYSTTGGVLTYTKPSWEWDNTLWQDAQDIEILLLRDTDADGAIDSITSETFDDLLPYKGTWQYFHEVP